jgi:hypothetical protein
MIAAAVPALPARVQILEREAVEATASEQKLLAVRQELRKSAAPKKAVIGVAGKQKGKREREWSLHCITVYTISTE